jgi:hypothetical protein
MAKTHRRPTDSRRPSRLLAMLHAPLAALGVAAALAGVTGVARADEFLDRVNATFAKVNKDRRSDLVLLPLLAKMEAPQRIFADPLRAALLTPQSNLWADATRWSTAKAQADVIEALAKVSSENQWRDAWAFAQPYGANDADPEMVAAGLYTELGENPTLSLAQFKYLDAIRNLEILAHVEASRLLSEGKGDDALKLMVNWSFVARQIADRQFLTEKRVGMEMLVRAFQRLRDIAFTDLRSDKPSITPEAIRDINYQRFEPVRGVMNLTRIELPVGDYEAARQVVARAFVTGARANRTEFSRLMARAAARTRPFRLFSENAKWDSVYSLHADTTNTRKRVDDVFGDWNRRWEVRPFDLLLKIPTDYSRLDKVQFASLDLILGDLGDLFPLRDQLRVEAAGTRVALAMYGFYRKSNNWPREITAPQPTFIRAMDRDPFSRRGAEFGFFVPGRENVFDFDGKKVASTIQGTQRPEDAPTQHVVRLFVKIPGLPDINFDVPLRADTCVIFSSGPDGASSAMTVATQMVEDSKGDYLIWPPELSLVRKHLGDTNRLP